MPTYTTEKNTIYSLTNPKIHKALQMYMYLSGTNGKFKFSEELEDRITKMKLHFNNDSSCYTDFTAIYIGLFFPYFTEDINENFNIAKGVIGHENGHLRLTSKRTWEKTRQTATGKYKRLARYAMDILNIVEDDRIEYWMGFISKFLRDMFYYLTHLISENIQKELDTIEENQELSAMQKLMIIRNGILFIRCTRSERLPKINNEEIMGYLKEILPYMMYGRKTKSTKRAVMVTHKIMEILSPLREEFEENDEDRIEGMFDDNSVGSDSPMENDDLDNISNPSKSKQKGKKASEKDENNAAEEESDVPEENKKIMKKIIKKVAKEMGDEEVSDDSTGTGDDGENDNDSSQEKDKAKDSSSGDKKSSNAEDKDKDSDESNTDKNKSVASNQKEDSEENSEEDSSASGSSNGKGTNQKTPNANGDDSGDKKLSANNVDDDNKSIRDYVEDITSNLEKYEGDINQAVKKRTEALKQEARKPVTKEILGDFMNSTKKSSQQKIMESEEAKKITELKPVLINEDLHKNCKPVFREQSDMEPFTPEEYAVYVEENINIIKRGANELLKLSEQKKQAKLRLQKRGRLDNRRLIKAAAFNAEDVFFKKRIEKDKIDMDVLIFIDRSGSNSSQVKNAMNDTYLRRYEVNRIAAVIQHEILKRAKITHAVWSFEEYGWDNVFTPMIHFTNCFEKDSGLYLKDIGASGSNRDGYAISYAGEYLMTHGKNQKKIMIVISDGQPAGVGGYGGMLAMNDVKNTIADLKKKGVKTIGIFTGTESENQYFNHMYEKPLFFNNDSIQKLPEELRKRLALEFKEYLNTI